MTNNDEIEEDFLNVDNCIPGQNYVCLSFISPEKILKNKELFIFHNFMKECCKEYNIEEKDLIEKFEDFKYKNEKQLTEEFTENNDFHTNVRGVKIRGVYDTKREADVRAKVLQRQDKNHNVFVGQVGYWLPWDPSLAYLDNVEGEYLDNDLNTLMKKYQENQDNKDMFFQDMVREKTTKTLNENMNKDDPWMEKINKEDKETEEDKEEINKVEEENKEKQECEEMKKNDINMDSENVIKTE